jgi:arsenate reductase
MTSRPVISCACVHDRGRSVAGEVLAEHYAGETCSAFPGKRYQDWVLEDPEGKDIETVRGIVDDIDGRVRPLLCHLGVDVPADAR